LLPFSQAVSFLIDLAGELEQDGGIDLGYIDAGGGLGIDYDGAAPDSAAWVRVVGPLVSDAGYEMVVEPGRSIVGRAGALLTRVIYTKDQGAKHFIITDAGMTDLIRPTLYQAHHPILPVAENDRASRAVDVVGPICETSDFLARDRMLPSPAAGDLLAVLHAGAYGYAMSSNYNGHLRPAEVLVEGVSFRIIRERQTYGDLLGGT
jgi:diaminopimelate decarboxylase